MLTDLTDLTDLTSLVRLAGQGSRCSARAGSTENGQVHHWARRDWDGVLSSAIGHADESRRQSAKASLLT